MSRIYDDLRYMNHLEIVLNYDGLGKMDETISELSKLSLNEQHDFIFQCEKHLSDINNSFTKFMKMYIKGDTMIEITNKQLAWIEANKSMGFECPKCKHTQIIKAWNYTHNYCPHCGAKINWNLEE